MSTAEIRIAPATEPGDLAAALAIREIVFIEEQAIRQEVERDDQDELAFHVLATQHGHAVGTGRLVTALEPSSGGSGKWGEISRMAVLAAHRKAGLGRLILRALEEHAHEQGLVGIVLHAQVMSNGFYEKEGYRAFDAVFEEAGMPHVKMLKTLARQSLIAGELVRSR